MIVSGPTAHRGVTRGPTARGTWRSYDATDGLPAGVWCLEQDASGYLWLGTRAGLCRYDGREFVAADAMAGLPDDEVMALAADAAGLWVGTRRGLCRIEGGTLTRYTTADGLPNDEIEDLCLTPEGVLWVATHGGVARLERGRWRALTTADGLPSDDVRRVYADRAGRIWCGTTAGLTRLDDLRLRTFNREDGLPGSHVLALCEDRTGRLWVGTLMGLAWLDGEHFTTLTLPDGEALVNVRTLLEDSAGRLWFGTIGQGLYCLDGDQVSHYGIGDGLLGEHVTCLVEDTEGHLWIGEGLSGLSCFHGRTIEFLSSEPVTEDLRQDEQGRFWFASGDQVCCLAAGEIRRRRFGCRVFGLLIDRAGRLWLATWGEGVYLFERPDDLFTSDGRWFTRDHGLGSSFIAGLLETAAGEVYAGSGHPGCLSRFTGDGFDSLAMPQKVVFRMLEAADGRIWVGGFSSGGLACADGQRVTHWDEADGLPSDAVQSLCEDGAGALWVGTRQGLVRFDGQRFEIHGKAAGFLTLDNQVSMVDAEGQLWFGTKCGVYRQREGHLQVLTTADGLPGNAVTALLPQPDGSTVIGTFHGLVRYRPTAVRPPLIRITEVIAGQVYEAPTAVELTATSAALVTISFGGLSLGTRRMRYSYRLVGHDATWRDTWDSQVRYEQLPVGDYTFQVLAINRDLVPSQEPAEVRVRVVVDPWREQQAVYEAEIGRMQQLLELHQRTIRQNRALVELAHAEAIADGDLAAGLQLVARTAAHTLALDRASVWWLDCEAGQLRALVSYDRGSDRWAQPGSIPTSQIPELLQLLDGTRALAADNAPLDPRLGEVSDAFRQQQTASLIQAPVRLGGQMIAVVQLEQRHQPRHWTHDEQQFAASLADLVSLAVEAHDRSEAEARLGFQAQLLEQVSDAVVAVDRSRRITAWNRAAERLYGWPAEEAIGQPLASRIDPLVPDLAWDAVWYSPTGLERRGEAVHHRRDGAPLQVEWSLSAIAAGPGEPSGAVAVLHDVTARKRAEEEQRRLEQQVQHSQKLESLGVLAGGIAHDFNNLLMGVMGNAGLALLELPAESPARHSVEQIELAAQRAAELTRQMLAYSGRGQFEVRPLNLSRLVLEMAHLLEVSISKKATLVYACADQLPAMVGDATQVRQVVMNLITNASDAMGDQAGTIAVSTGCLHASRQVLAETYLNDELPEGQYVFVEVTDTGCGMDADTRERIFEPFFTTKFTGRGLGLAAVLGIVRGHGGAVSLTSEPGQGTTFRVLFPASTEAAAEGSAAEAHEESYQGSGTILVVDDEASVRQVVVRTLEQFGFAVVEAADGEEALRLYRDQAADLALVVLDLTMPRMDGQECLQALQEVRGDVRVILSSGHDERDAMARFAGRGIAAFLQKPYGPRQLLQKVRGVLGD